MDTLCTAIDHVWRGARVAALQSSHAIQHVLSACSDLVGDVAFEEKRAQLEREWFMHAIMRPLLCKHGEQGLWDFAQCMGLHVERVRVIELEDWKGYIHRHGSNVPRPTMFYAVPMEHVDSLAGHTVYTGGVVRIAHLDMPQWLWHHVCAQRAVLAATHYSVRGERVPPPQLVHVAREMVQRDPRRAYAQRAATGHVRDVEELAATAAPCMQRVLRGKRFPKNDERNALVRAMLTGRVAPELVEPALVAIHRRERANATVADTKRRFDYTFEVEKRYAPTQCGALAHVCPYTGGDDVRAQQCHAAYLEAHPNARVKDSDYRNFGPHKYWLFHSRHVTDNGHSPG